MISSGVVPCGCVFSSGPSWARAEGTTSAQARQATSNRKIVPDAGFILSILSDKGCHAGVAWNAAELRPEYTPRPIPGPASTAATLPPTPLRSVRPEGRVLQFCHSLGCLRRKEVAARSSFQSDKGFKVSDSHERLVGSPLSYFVILSEAKACALCRQWRRCRRNAEVLRPQKALASG